MIQKKHNRKGPMILVSFMLSMIFVLGTCYLSSEGLSTFNLNISLGSADSGDYAIDRDNGKPVNESGVQFVLYNISEQYRNEIEKIEKITDSDKLKAEDMRQKRYGLIRDELDRLSDEDLSKRFPEKYISEPTDSSGKLTVENMREGVYYIKEKDTGSRVDVESIVIKLPLGNNYRKPSNIFPKASIVTSGNGGGTNEGGGNKGGKRFIKTDDGKKFKRLPNAKFIISRKENGNMVTVKRNGKDMVLESDKDGRFQVDNLDFGEYFLIETQAPKVDSVVYNILEKPVSFTIDRDSYDENHALRIVDTAVGEEPNPGRGEGNKTVPGKTENTKEEKNSKKEKNRNNEEPKKTRSSNEKRRITIPKTGDIQIFIYSLVGMAIIFIGTSLYRKETQF